MAYVPVAQRTGTSTGAAPAAGYVPVSARAVVEPPGPGMLGETGVSITTRPTTTKTSTQAIPDSTTGSTIDTIKGAFQGVTRDAALIGIAAGQDILQLISPKLGAKARATTVPVSGANALLLGKGEEGKPNALDTSVFADTAVKYENYLKDTPFAKGATPIAVLGSVLPTSLDFLGGGETKGATALFKAVQATDASAEGIAKTYGILKGVGFADDIATQYAELLAKSKDFKYIKEAILNAKKLQETTHGVEPRAYVPVAERAADVKPAAAEIGAKVLQVPKIPIPKGLPPILEDMKTQVEIGKETLTNMPGRDLAKYVSRETGMLPELGAKTGPNGRPSKSVFAKRGDSITQDVLGQDASGGGDVLNAQDAVDQYKAMKLRVSQLEEQFKQAKLDHRDQKIIDELSNRIEADNVRLRQFADQYPDLYKLTGPLTKEGERTAKIGFRAGRQAERRNIFDQLRVKQAKTDSVRSQVVRYASDNLPLHERGKLLAMVRDAKTQKDLTKAFVRIDNKAEEVAVKDAITQLKETANKLVDSTSISADYRNQIKEIVSQYELTGHTKETIAKLKATQDYLDRAEAEGKDVEIPQRILDKLEILGRVPKDQLTLTQLQGLQAEIELLAQLGKTKWATKQALYVSEQEMRKRALLEVASPLTSKELPKAEIGSKPSFFAKRYISMRNYLQKTRIGLTPMEGLADLTGMHPVKEVMDLNFGNYLTYNDEANKGWLALTKGFTDKNYERIGAVAMARQKGGIERLANSGITQAEVEAIDLTAEEEAAYQFARATFEKEYPNVKKYALDNYNADVGQVDNYVSFMSDYDAMSDLELYDRFGQRAEEVVDKRTKTVEQGFTKERAALSRNKLELNIDKIFRRHTDDVAYMLTMGHDIKQYFEIVNSKEMREKLGDVGTLAWLQYLDLMARKGGSDSAKRIAALDIVRKNIGAGTLAFRLSSALVQFTSFADTIGTIGAEYATKGAASIAGSREWRNFIMDNFPEIKKAVGDDIAFREFADSYIGRASQIGMKPLTFLDGLMRSTAAAGAYAKLAAERGIVVDLAKPDKKLIADATRLMRQSQGSSFFKDQPLALTTGYGLTDNKSLNKTILTFQSFMLNRWDNMQRQIWRLGIKEGDYKKAATSAFWMIVFSAAMEEGIRRGVRSATNFVTGDDQPEQSFIGNSVLNAVQSVPIAGSLVSAMTYSSNPVPVINTFEDLISGTGSAVQGKAVNTKARGAVQAAGAAGSLLGVPGSSQAAQLIRKAIPQASGGSSSSKESKPKALKAPKGLPELPSLTQSLPTPPGLPKLPSP